MDADDAVLDASHHGGIAHELLGRTGPGASWGFVDGRGLVRLGARSDKRGENGRGQQNAGSRRVGQTWAHGANKLGVMSEDGQGFPGYGRMSYTSLTTAGAARIVSRDSAPAPAHDQLALHRAPHDPPRAERDVDRAPLPVPALRPHHQVEGRQRRGQLPPRNARSSPWAPVPAAGG